MVKAELKASWLADISSHASGSQLDLQSFWGAFLACDLNQAGAGCLPTGLKEWHKQKIGGRYIVQVDEVVNIALPIRQRHGQNGKGRCVKMSLTDGKQQVEGLEYRHLPDVGPDMPAGFKMALTDVEVRRGMLLLQPENTQVLGGCVARLEDARQRCLTSLRKPAEGRGGNRNMQPIHPAAAATAAAWPSILPANQAPSSIPIQGPSSAEMQPPLPSSNPMASTSQHQLIPNPCMPHFRGQAAGQTIARPVASLQQALQPGSMALQHQEENVAANGRHARTAGLFTATTSQPPQPNSTLVASAPRQWHNGSFNISQPASQGTNTSRRAQHYYHHQQQQQQQNYRGANGEASEAGQGRNSHLQTAADTGARMGTSFPGSRHLHQQGAVGQAPATSRSAEDAASAASRLPRHISTTQASLRGGADAAGPDEEMEEAGTPTPARNQPLPADGRYCSRTQPPLPATHAGAVWPHRAPSTPADVIVLEDDPTPTPARQPSAERDELPAVATRRRRLVLSSDDEDEADTRKGDDTNDDAPAHNHGWTGATGGASNNGNDIAVDNCSFQDRPYQPGDHSDHDHCPHRDPADYDQHYSHDNHAASTDEMQHDGPLQHPHDQAGYEADSGVMHDGHALPPYPSYGYPAYEDGDVQADAVLVAEPGADGFEACGEQQMDSDADVIPDPGYPLKGIRSFGRVKKATSSLVFADQEKNEHETFVVHVLLELDVTPDLQKAKLGALVLQDIIGLGVDEAAAMLEQNPEELKARLGKLKTFMRTWKGDMELQQEAHDELPVITKLLEPGC
ncbi:hypothetical protein WJX74_008809 [Apatococcus lobatus]|uniref:RecQ-mediated genome instability protein 1 n=1 Tax=Apatococcus lobatus TaxID=904363 RepID=A0AAW1REW1_9CHLO